MGGGTPKIEKAFLTEKYEKENADHKELIKQLKEILPVYIEGGKG